MNKQNLLVVVVVILLAILVLTFSNKKAIAPVPNQTATTTPSNVPVAITVSGVGECLPHRNTDGPQTMECAYGLKADSGTNHYALDLHNIEGAAMNFQTQKHVKVTGTLVPKNQLNTNTWDIYNIDGIIKVESIEII